MSQISGRFPLSRVFKAMSGSLMPVLSVLAPIMVFAVSLNAQIPVHINSGDPAFPFPQFLPYAHPNGDTLYNLGMRPGEGVTHAEMEQSIRDAYRIMMNRAEYITHNGLDRVGGPNGTRYIWFNSTCHCSEGDGYAMLAAAMMADKVTFDGLWLYVHDFRMNRVTRYGDGGANTPDYKYAPLPGVYGGGAGDDSAADGDFDIAMALMIAHMQWGDLMGINDSRGNPISYRDDFLKVIRAMTDTLVNREALPERELLTGNIGFDGYFRGGNTWGELTKWAELVENLMSIGVRNTARVYQPSGNGQYFDYNAPAYFRQFADYLKQLPNAAADGWNISQYERAEASSDWLMGQLIGQSQRNIPFAGDVRFAPGSNTPTFGNVQGSEDMRAPWRTVLNYLWHGNPVNSWDPEKHVVIRNTSNTYQRDAGRRFARFLWDRRQAPWNAPCDRITGEGLWWGPSMIREQYLIDGTDRGEFRENWVQGTGSPSAVVSQDFNLMAEMYRQAEIEWNIDPVNPAQEDRYLRSRPFYFHGFFRLLGMMILTGNHHAPLSMKRQPNMKVYLDVDKTYAFESDTITYYIDYRNYGAEDARGVRIVNRLHSDMFPVSISGGGEVDWASNTVRWDIGAVSGFRTSTGIAPTVGRCTLKVIIPYANLKRYENSVEITATNGPGWVSSEYPNRVSSIMKRNGVDIARRALRVDHSVYRDTVNPGMTAVYTIDFENSAEAGWLNGGRPGVQFTYAHSGTQATAGSHTFMVRAFNDAQEAYVDYGNYRISYFMFDNNFRGIGGNNGWSAPVDIVYPPAAAERVALRHENITPGEDGWGKWNQRLIMQVSDTQADTNWITMGAPTQFLINYSGLDQRVHRGTSWPFKAVWRMFGGQYANRNWGGDWSFNRSAAGDIANDALENWGYPITPDFTDDPDPDNPGKPVTTIHRKLCGAAPSVTVGNILIEEWDGYTWRRVYGNGPLPGREVNNVVIRDTLPNGVTFREFIGAAPFGVEPKINGRVITWEIDQLLVGQSGRIQYSVRADTPSVFSNVTITSRAWAEADRESPTFSPAYLVVTRDSLPPPPPEPTTMHKTANKNTYQYGDTIHYTITYKQTHGYPVKSTSAGQWSSSAGVSSDGGTITFGSNNVDTRFNPSLGTNMTLTGTVVPERYLEPFAIYLRDNGAGPAAELFFEWKWEGLIVGVESEGRTRDSVVIAVTPPPEGSDERVMLDYKIVLRDDELQLWVGDTTLHHPFMSRVGVPMRQGYAGVRYTSPGYGNALLTGWEVLTDLAYDVVIRDTIPWGLSYISNSASGDINTGALSPRALTPTVSNGIITWPVVSGDTPLGANDSLTVTWSAVIDTARNNRIINTAYADLRGHPRDATGAQLLTGIGGQNIPDIPDIPDNPDDPLTGLYVRAEPRDSIFTGSITVTLTSLPGASIWYTTNGMIPDSTSQLITRRYTGQPLEFTTSTTLRAIAYAPGHEPSRVARFVYEPLRTVPVLSAIFYDNTGDGLANGVKVALPPSRADEANQAVIRRHQNLINMPGLPVTIDTLVFVDDTITIRFRGAGVEPALDSRLVISEPTLPSAQYTSAHGYLAERTLTIIDGVAPVITEAIYYPSLSAVDGMGGVYGDTLAVTFNKYAALSSTVGAVSPFVLSYAGGTYEFELEYVRNVGGTNTIVFLVRSIGGRNPVSVPAAGDSIRIKVDEDHIMNIYSYVQRNPFNRAVPLKIRYPDLEYSVKAGPSPFRDRMTVWVGVEPFLPSVFEALDPVLHIFDRLGNVVAVSGKDLSVSVSDNRYVIEWDGRNSRGRRVSSGTYLIRVTVSDQDGRRIVPKEGRRTVYVDRD